MKVLVIGDSIVDHYVFGNVDRISPECPVPVLDATEEKYVLGGAANVAANIRSLSEKGLDIDYFGFNSLSMCREFDKRNIRVVGVPVAEDEILKKTRFVCKNHQMLRVDFNKRYPQDLIAMSEHMLFQLSLESYDLIVISDYAKGTVFENPGLEATRWNKFIGLKIPTLIDLKCHRDFFDKMDFPEAKKLAIKFNDKEFVEGNIQHMIMWGDPFDVILTCGGNGYCVNGQEFPAFSRGKILDVVGAGDVFLAGMAVKFLESGEYNIKNMANFGAICAAEKINHFGTIEVKREWLK